MIIAPGEGRIAVALPLDPRTDWPRVAADVPEFLERFAGAEGAKYWEQPERTLADLLTELALAARSVPEYVPWAEPSSNVVELAASGKPVLDTLEGMAFPGEWRALYEACMEIRLADVENGYFVHPVSHVIADIRRGAPTHTTGTHELTILPFASDGGGGLFGFSESGEVYFLPPGRVTDGVYASDSKEFAVFTSSITDFIRALLARASHH